MDSEERSGLNFLCASERSVMPEKNSHCSFCGSKFKGGEWPRTCASCGSKSYMNPIPVIVVLIPSGNGLVAVRRNIDPQKGLLALPGGYLDYGESWQEGGSRELREETGIEIEPDDLSLYDVLTAPDGTVVIFGLAGKTREERLNPFRSEECQEITVIDDPEQLCFELHVRVVSRFFSEKRLQKRT